MTTTTNTYAAWLQSTLSDIQHYMIFDLGVESILGESNNMVYSFDGISIISECLDTGNLTLIVDDHNKAWFAGFSKEATKVMEDKRAKKAAKQTSRNDLLAMLRASEI